MVEALGWGAVAASSLLIGALGGLARPWPPRAIGLVLGFGAGALISAVSFELAEDGVEIGGGPAVGIGLAVGALTYFVCATAIERRSGDDEAGSALALGALLDGIPEQLVLGLGIALGNGVSVGLLGAIFVSNLPEAIQGAINGFAAGALVVMLVDSMIPEATRQAGRTTGLVTTLGFAVAAGMSGIG